MWTPPHDEAKADVVVKNQKGDSVNSCKPGDYLDVTLSYSGTEDLLTGAQNAGYHDGLTYQKNNSPNFVDAEVTSRVVGSYQKLTATIRVPEGAEWPLRFGISVKNAEGKQIGYHSEPLELAP